MDDDAETDLDPGDVLNPADYIVIERAVYEREREDRAGSRRLVAVAIALLALALLVATGFSIYDRVQQANQETKRADRAERLLDAVEAVGGDLEDVSEVVDAVRDATSTEAQEAQAKRLAGVITEVDCRNRAALQELADALADAGTAATVTIRCA